MPVCSYMVLPEPGEARSLSRRLATLPGCDVTPSRNRNLLLLVTDTPSPEQDRELRSTLEKMEGIHALILTFGEIDPETEEADPVGAGRKHRRPGPGTGSRQPGPGERQRAPSQGPARPLPVIHPAHLGELRQAARPEGEAASPNDRAEGPAASPPSSPPDQGDP